MSAPSITGLWAAWQAAHAEFEHLWEESDRRHGELDHALPMPAITHGRRGWCILSEHEIDNARRLSDTTKARLKARLRKQIDRYDKARDAAGLTALDERCDAAAKAMGRAGSAIAADRSGTVESLHTKLSLIMEMSRHGSDLSGVDGDVLCSAFADAEALVRAPVLRAYGGAEGRRVVFPHPGVYEVHDATGRRLAGFCAVPEDGTTDDDARRHAEELAAAPELMRLSALMGFGPGAVSGPAADEVTLLLDLERQHHALDQAYDAIPDSEPDEVWQPVYQRISDIEIRIADTPITTMAGALVKLRLARGPVGTGDGETPTYCMESACATLEAVAMSAGYLPPWPGKATVAAGGAA